MGLIKTIIVIIILNYRASIGQRMCRPSKEVSSHYHQYYIDNPVSYQLQCKRKWLKIFNIYLLSQRPTLNKKHLQKSTTHHMISYMIY